jgi:hypothetical protein
VVLDAIGQQRGHAAYACGLGLAADLLDLRNAPRRVGSRDRAVWVEPGPFCCRAISASAAMSSSSQKNAS